MASTPRPAMHVTAITTATGRAVMMRAITSRHVLVCVSAASRRRRRIESTGREKMRARRALSISPASVVSSGSGSGVAPPPPNSRPPNSAINAGASVIETARAISVVSASPGPNGAEEPELADHQRAGARRDDQPAVKTIGAVRAGRRPRRFQPGLAEAHAPPGLREEEDRVVGDEAEQQHDDDRLHLGRHARAGLLPRPRQYADRDRVRDPGREQRDQRRADRAERQPDDQQDEHDAARLDERERTLDLLVLREPRRGRAGRPDDGDAAEVPARVALGHRAALVRLAASSKNR
jgi:hypothetical protein